MITLGSSRRRALPAAGAWTIDPAHTVVRAVARHLGLPTVEGRFTAFERVIRVACRGWEMNWNMGLPGGFVLVGPAPRIDLAVRAVQG